jgi:PAS domain-containing protein
VRFGFRTDSVTNRPLFGDDSLVKPFSARELRARVRANLELDRVRRVAGELRRSQTLLDQAEELAHVGSWELDLRDGRLSASAEYLRIAGLPAGALGDAGGLDRAVQAVHPDDRERVLRELERAVLSAEPLDYECRIVHPERGERIVRTRAVVHLAADGTAQFLRGSAQDVTEQRRGEQAIAATAIARESAAREHAIAEQLQRSLLPTGVPAPSGLDVAAYYVAGVEGTQAGGDWYDVIDVGGGRSALVVGDVMGRGVRAAAVMGQLRATVRAYARLDLDPGRLLALLDAAVLEARQGTIVTCVYGICDPVAGRFTYGNAGHLPPLLAVPGGPTRRLTAGDPPLGSGGYRGAVETVELPPGARLTLYTDGLVEHRGSDIDTGIDKLAAVLDATDAPVEAVPGVAVEALLPAEPDDDVAVLAAAVVAGAQRRAVLPIGSGPDAVAGVRRGAAAALTGWGVPGDVADDVQLIVSELATNCVRYGAPPMQLTLRLDPGAVVVDAWDAATARPRPRPFDPAAPNGRGLHLVAGLSRAWGVRPTGAGKSVWCVVPLSPAE